MESTKTRQMGYRADADLLAAFKARVAALEPQVRGPDGRLSESKTVEMCMALLVELPMAESIQLIRSARAAYRQWSDKQEAAQLGEHPCPAPAPDPDHGQGKPAGGVVLDLPRPKPQSSSSSRPPGQGKPRGHR